MFSMRLSAAELAEIESRVANSPVNSTAEYVRLIVTTPCEHIFHEGQCVCCWQFEPDPEETGDSNARE
jgi:hypothetical protein